MHNKCIPMNASLSKRGILSAFIFTLALVAQPNTTAPRFEVASIKPIDPNAAMHRSGLSIYPGGRVEIPTTTLKGMIVTAFGVSYWQLSGGEPWMEKDQYDVEAKPPANLQPAITNLRHGLFDIDDERLRQMLQAMLIERFNLKFHRETKTGKVYLLEKKGSTQALRPADDASIERNMPASPQESSVGLDQTRPYGLQSGSELRQDRVSHRIRGRRAAPLRTDDYHELEPLALPWISIWAFVRISTNPRISTPPMAPREAFAMIAEWLNQPGVVLLNPGPLHTQILEKLVRDFGATGPLVTDAVLADVEYGASSHRPDQDFRRECRICRWKMEHFQYLNAAVGEVCDRPPHEGSRDRPDGVARIL